MKILTTILIMIASFANVQAQDMVGKSKTTMDLKIRESSGPFGKAISEIPKDSTVILLNENENSYIKVIFRTDTGFVNSSFLTNKELVNKIIYKGRDPKLVGLEKRFSKEVAYKIYKNKYWIGMTDKMLRASIGSPRDINRTVTAYGVSEQWVYGKFPNSKYFYFQDGILESWQE